MKIKLTKSAIERIAAPAKGRLTVHDTATNGLCVRITAANDRKFYYCRWRDGRVAWAKLGDVTGKDALTIEEAQRKVGAINEKPEIDPNAEKRARREAVTLRDLWVTYRTAVRKAPRTMQEEEGVWKRYLEPWKSGRVAEITQEAAQGLYNRIAAGKLNRETKDKFGHTRPIKGGPTAARHALKLLSVMYTECAKKAVNPARGVKKKKERPCKRYLEAYELPAFWVAMEAQDELIRDMLKMAMFTAQRRSTLLAMRWEEINMNFKTWTIPAAKMKSGEAHVVPLVPAAMELLVRRQKASTGGEWVFENVESSTGHLLNPEKAIERIWKAAGIPAFSLHDLRRTTATWMNQAGATYGAIHAILAHSEEKVTDIYLKGTADTMRTGLEAGIMAIMTTAGNAYAPPLPSQAAA